MLKTNKTEINLIVYEYLKEELRSKGFNLPIELEFNENEITLSPNKLKQIIEILCKLTHSICKTFNDNLNQMCINIEHKMIENSSNLIELEYSAFKHVADELFSHGYKWLHIICLFIFSFKLIIFKINDKRLPELTKNICDYLTMYLSQNLLLEWINQNNGWSGLIESEKNFFESKTNSIQSNNNSKFNLSSSSSNLKFGFLGVALFGIFLLKH